MKTPTLNVKKKRLLRKTNECLNLINVGNTKIQNTLNDLIPMITTNELEEVYMNLRRIMTMQCDMYRVILSEKEEK